MAQKYLVQILDDLDGTELDQNDAEQIAFSLDGVAYLIDLSPTNAAALHDTLRPYIDAARRADTVTRTSSSRTTTSSQKRADGKRSDLDKVRAWANANDRPVSSRGRIPTAILNAYDADH